MNYTNSSGNEQTADPQDGKWNLWQYQGETVMPRSKTYRDPHGMYLAIDDRDYDICIGWHDGDDFGAYVGDGHEENASQDSVTALKACKPFSDGTARYRGLRFDSIKQARLALTAANAALLNGKTLPAWAVQATAAGWKPPKGWKP